MQFQFRFQFQLPILLLLLFSPTPLGVLAMDYAKAGPLAESIPACSTECLLTALDTARCGMTNYECQCGKSEEIGAGAAECLSNACEREDLIATEKIIGEVCRLYYEGVRTNSSDIFAPEGEMGYSQQPNGVGRLDAGVIWLFGVVALAFYV